MSIPTDLAQARGQASARRLSETVPNREGFPRYQWKHYIRPSIMSGCTHRPCVNIFNVNELTVEKDGKQVVACPQVDVLAGRMYILPYSPRVWTLVTQTWFGGGPYEEIIEDV